jgi:hypothetical protein
MSDFTISNAVVIPGCKYPYRAEVTMPPEATEDDDREFGKAMHEAAAALINEGKEPDADMLAELGTAWLSARAWILANWKDSWVGEPAYAWLPVDDTARFLGVNIGRAYAIFGKLPHEKGGTLDVRSIEGETGYVYEFGTGHDIGHKYDQLRLQCAVFALAHNLTRVVGQLVRFAEDGAYPLPPVEFDEFALAAIRGEFAEYLSQVEGSEPTPGEHCTRCSLAPVCPAGTAIVQALIPVEALVKPGWGLTIANADHAAWLLNHLRLVGASVEAVKEAVKAYVPKGGLVLSDGSLLYEATRNISRKNHAKVEALARALGATDEQIESCSAVVQESAGLKVRKPTATKRKKAA